MSPFDLLPNQLTQRIAKFIPGIAKVNKIKIILMIIQSRHFIIFFIVRPKVSYKTVRISTAGIFTIMLFCPYIIHVAFCRDS